MKIYVVGLLVPQIIPGGQSLKLKQRNGDDVPLWASLYGLREK
jgi:hypothetical protein